MKKLHLFLFMMFLCVTSVSAQNPTLRTVAEKPMCCQMPSCPMASCAKKATPAAYSDSFHQLSIGTNLLYWAILTPNITAEYKLDNMFGFVMKFAGTYLEWNNAERYYRTWVFNPEFRVYPTRANWYVGTEFHRGDLNLKLKDNGRQGRIVGGGLTTGYQMSLTRSLYLDFNIGLGCTHFHYDKFEVQDGVKVLKEANKQENIWGPTQVGVSLMWKIIK